MGMEREHDHLEGHDHREDAERVDDLAELGVHAGDVPGCHGAADEDQRRGEHGDQGAVAKRTPERVVAEGHAGDEVGPTGKALLRGQGKGLGLDEGVQLEGVDRHAHNRENPDDADDGEDDGQDLLVTRLGCERLWLVCHYCCTSLLRVYESCASPMAATRTKNMTALAWATPRDAPVPE